MRYIFRLVLSVLGISVLLTTYFMGYLKEAVLLSLNSSKSIVDNTLISSQEKQDITSPLDSGQSLDDLKRCQEMRLKTFREVCKALSSSYTTPVRDLNESTLSRISGLVDDDHKFFMRAFAKTGCTSWKTIMFNNSKGVNLRRIPYDVHIGHLRYGLHKMKDEPTHEERLKKLETYFIALNVRHPLERLESAYRDKFAKPTNYRDSYLRKLHKDPKLRDSPEAQDDQVSFAEFLDLVIQEKSHDMHWKPYLEMNVCNMKADYIARTESSVADMNYIIQYKLSNKGRYIASHSTGGVPTPKTSVHLPLFSALPNPQDYIDKLSTRLYKEDMALFGYSYRMEPVTKNITGYCENVVNGLCC